MDLAAWMQRDDVAQEVDEAALVCRGTVWPMTSPVFVFNAAYRDSVPWR